MTICNLDGDLICNIYGPDWTTDSSDISHYWNVNVCGDKIIASYSGGDRRTEAYYPTKFLVFNLNGDYLKTLETGYRIVRFCYDEDNNRIIMCMDDDIQFSYLDLNEVI